MSAIASVPQSAIPTAIIGKTLVIKGDIHSQEPLTIEGQVDGTIEIDDHLLTIASGATVRDHVTGYNVELRGRVEGQVEAAATLSIRKDAEFIGDIRASSLVIEDGSYIKGNIELSRPPASIPSARGLALVDDSDVIELDAMRGLSHAMRDSSQ
jgi:cytoskeletal protein CcmA (bactofilin family)